MASENEETTVAAVPHIVKNLQRTVRSGITRPAEWRMQQLRAILKLVQENEERIIQVLAQDIGKPAHEAFLTEILVATDSCKLAIKELKKWMAPQKVPITLVAFPGTAEVIPEPFGVALIISPWNFPFVLAIDPIIGALAAGCAVVLKPSEITPTVSSLLAELIPQYLDTDAIQVVEGGVPVVTALLEQKWDKIFYTGSPRVGRIVMAAAAKHLTPVTLELGGKCPVYIDDSVDLKVSAMRICLGKWGVNVGQTCIAPDYLLVEEDIVSKLVETMKTTIVQFFGEDPSTSADIGRIVNEFHFQRLKGLLDDPRTAERIVYGGQCDKKSLSIAPTLVLDVPLDTPIMSDEIFGPILPIITVKGVEKAMDVILEFPKPLALYIFTMRKAVEEQLLTGISAGGVGINETISHFAVPGLPFGGVGESGMGAYHGKHSFDAFRVVVSLIRIPFSPRQAGVLMRRCPQGNMGILKTPQLQLVLLVIWTLLFIEAAFPQLLNAAASEELSEKRLQIYEGSDIGARKLLQAVQQCPVNFEVQNYSSITSVCVAPNYDSTLCCPPFVDFVCKFLTYFNDQSTDCASTLFSYLNLAGHYPAGLFANECTGGPQGIACPIVPAPSPDPSGVVLIRPKLSSLAFMSLFALLFRVLIF